MQENRQTRGICTQNSLTSEPPSCARRTYSLDLMLCCDETPSISKAASTQQSRDRPHLEGVRYKKRKILCFVSQSGRGMKVGIISKITDCNQTNLKIYNQVITCAATWIWLLYIVSLHLAPITVVNRILALSTLVCSHTKPPGPLSQLTRMPRHAH